MEPMVYMKVYEVNGEKVVAICDEDVLGEKFEENGITLYVDPAFYGDTLVPLSMAIREAEDATIVNIVGENAVNEAIRRGLVHPDAVLRVAGVPHAQIIKMLW